MAKSHVRQPFPLGPESVKSTNLIGVSDDAAKSRAPEYPVTVLDMAPTSFPMVSKKVAFITSALGALGSASKPNLYTGELSVMRTSLDPLLQSTGGQDGNDTRQP